MASYYEQIIWVLRDIVTPVLAIFSTLVLLVILYWLKSTLMVLFRVRLMGGTAGIHIRGIFAMLHYIPKNAEDFKLEDKKKGDFTWTIDRESIMLLPGSIPFTIMIDGIAKTFNPTQIFDIVKAHIENLKVFGVPVIDKETREHIKDKDGNPLFQYPIDPRSPAYVIPRILSAKSLAECIKVEANKMKEKLVGDERKMVYMGAFVGLAILAVGAIIILGNWAFKYEVCQAEAFAITARAIATTTTLATGGLVPPTDL